MIDKTIERKIKFPRVRICDCSRLIFRLGEEPSWRKIDLDPDLFPIYPLPPLSRRVYNFLDTEIIIKPDETINNLIEELCSLISDRGDRSYIHTIIFRTTGEINIQIETI